MPTTAPKTKPKQSVVTALWDAADGHIAEIEGARVVLVRSAQGMFTYLKTFEGALKTLNAHGEHLQAVIDEGRDLNLNMRGRRTDLGVVA